MRTARSLTSGENLLDFFTAPFSHIGDSSKPGAIQKKIQYVAEIGHN
jgi:hypothetical protein